MLDKLFKKGTPSKGYRYVTFGFMLFGGILALFAAFILTLDKLEVLENPDAVLSCSLNIVLNCSTVMQTWQSHVFGIPNMFIGLMAFPVLITIAVLGLSGVKFPRWFLVSSIIALFLGFIFSYWLFFSSLYVIQVLCPWCILVTTAMTIMLSSYLHFNLKENTFRLKEPLNTKVQYFLKTGFHQMIVLSWIALMVVLVVIKFGDALFA
ncbi:vitamin K epoxide reductase family protein [Candidatus Saccharibacteria bacterium]|nr:vitamin K epoxide reductase family protein [Candidatus Saccharibacteria bacterium]